MATTAKKGIGRAIIQGSQGFVSFFFSLIAVYVIFALFFSSVIIAMQVTGLLSDSNKVQGSIIWIAGLVLSISIEAASLGCFDMAAQMKARGQNERAGGLKTMAWILTGVMALTLLFGVFHVQGTADDILKGVRVIVAVVYALVAHSNGEPDSVTEEQRNRIQEMFLQFRTQQVEGMIAQCLDKLKNEAGQNEAKTRQKNEAEIRQALDTMRQENEAMRQQSEATMRQMLEEMRQENEAKTKHLVETMKQEQETALKQLKAASKEAPRETHPPTPLRPVNVVDLGNKDALKARAYQLADEGLSSYDIAERTNKPAKTIQRWLRERSTGITEEATGTEE
jgi:flagellar biosynthesis GTPase FlhF